MSVRASTWAWEQIRTRHLANGQALVLLRVADHADNTGLCWLGVDGIAEYAAMDESTVRRALRKLAELELLSRRPRQQEEGRGRAADLIQLHLPPRSDQPGETPAENGTPRIASQEPAGGAEGDDQPGNRTDQPGETPAERTDDQPGKSPRPTGQMTPDQPGKSPTPTDIGNRKEPSENRVPPPGDTADWPVFVHRLCDLHCELVNERTARRKPYRVTDEWLVEMERLIRIDGRSVEEVERAIRWVHADPFWAPNILSVPKLRERFDTIRLQARRSSGGSTGKPSAAAEQLQRRVAERARSAA